MGVNHKGYERIRKKNIDFPVFKSSLFPSYKKEVDSVNNNFQEIMSEAKEKMTSNNLKEEQMMRDAELLLASLGIDLNSVQSTVDSQINDGPSRDELKASLKIDSVKKDILKRLKDYR